MVLSPGSFDHVRLRRLREERRLTQSSLGALVGVTEYTVYEWEAGKIRPSAKHVGKLAAVLSAPTSELYTPSQSTGHLKDLRVLAGLTQIELVEKFNRITDLPEVTQSKVSNWERAKTRVPQEIVTRYANFLGVTEAELEEAAQRTWDDGRKAVPWAPAIDHRQRDFKGVAVGSRELESIYVLAGYLFSLTELVFVRAAMLRDGKSDSAREDELHFLNMVIWHHYRLLRELRNWPIQVINRSAKVDEDIAERARSVIWNLDQHLTIAEDLLGLPREKLVPPHDMFGGAWGEPSDEQEGD